MKLIGGVILSADLRFADLRFFCDRCRIDSAASALHGTIFNDKSQVVGVDALAEHLRFRSQFHHAHGRETRTR